MIIILEGIDGSGKTTVAEKLRDRFGYTYWHAGPPERHPLYEYEVPLHDLHPLEDAVVCDRWHMGEVVYGPIYRGRSQLEGPGYQHVELLLRAKGALVVRLKRDINDTVATVIRDGDDYVKVEHLPQLQEAYDKLPVTLTLEGFLSDPTVSGLAALARVMAEAVLPLHRFVTYVGSPRPTGLLFGDVRNVRHEWQGRHQSAFVPYPGTSGHYLLSHLDCLGNDLGLANACDDDDPADLWKVVGKPPVVALGKNADARLAEMGVPHLAVPHPQFMRRFHHRDGRRYAQDILQAIKDQR